MAKGKLNFSDKQTEQLFKDVHSGAINLMNLPENLYNATGEELTEGVLKGSGVKSSINIQAPANDTIRQLKKSVYNFSAAKQFQFISDMQNFLFNEKGFIRPFNEFKGFADVINNQYNKNWLEAEYVTSINMAHGASDWERIQEEKEIFPYLKYETTGDGRVRDEHAALNGIVRRIDDPFWSDFMPPNGWRCRCQAIQRESGKETNLSKKNIPKLDPVFNGNSGKRKTVFKKAHPYYSVPKKFNKHKANNFGLPLPDDVKEVKSFVPKNIKEVVDVDVSPSFWNLLKTKTTVRKSIGKEGSFVKGDGVVLDSKRFTTDHGKRKIIYHEYGHVIHQQNKWVARSFDGSGINKKVRTFGDKWMKLFKGKKVSEQIFEPKGLGLEINSSLLNKKAGEHWAWRGSIQKNHFPEMARADFDENFGSMMDAVAALTKGRLGWGHKVSYWKGSQGEFSQFAEIMAHSFENKFNGNPVFKLCFPEMYKDTIELLDELIKEL